MNKILAFTISTTFSIFLLFTFHNNANAQSLDDSILVTNPGDITFGAGITAGTSTGLLGNSETGLTGQIYYTVTDEFRGGVDFTYYLIGERQLNANELNFNVHYFVRNRNSLTLYGLGGINITNTSGSRARWLEEEGDPDTRKVGLNLGGGLEIRVGNLVLYGEPKLTLLGGSQFAATAGLRFIL